LTLVVADGTKLFIDATELGIFSKKGGHLLALRGIRMAGITLNPFSPFGGSFDAPEFFAAACKAFPSHVVTDVLFEKPLDAYSLPHSPFDTAILAEGTCP
jgi:hypothetical protein